MMYQRVLLAYDGSPSGRTALLECAEINGLLHAELHLLAVAPLTTGLYLAEGFVPDSLQEDENRHFDAVLAEGLSLLDAKGVTAQGHMVTGEPVEEIAGLATAIRAELIVVGHRRHGSMLERWWRGSVGASLIEQAPCSVLISISG